MLTIKTKRKLMKKINLILATLILSSSIAFAKGNGEGGGKYRYNAPETATFSEDGTGEKKQYRYQKKYQKKNQNQTQEDYTREITE